MNVLFLNCIIYQNRLNILAKYTITHLTTTKFFFHNYGKTFLEKNGNVESAAFSKHASLCLEIVKSQEVVYGQAKEHPG